MEIKTKIKGILAMGILITVGAIIGYVLAQAPPTQGHPPSEISPGSFQTGTYTFPGDLNVGDDISFDGDLRPDGNLCNNGQILQRTSADNWNCVDMPSSSSGSGGCIDYFTRDLPGSVSCDGRCGWDVEDLDIGDSMYIQGSCVTAREVNIGEVPCSVTGGGNPKICVCCHNVDDVRIPPF